VRAFAAGTLLALFTSAFLAAGCARESDPDFDARVPEPAHVQSHPVVVFDEGHHNVHTAAGAYEPFADLLRADGYTVRATKSPFTTEQLADVAVLVIAGARGANDAGDEPAFAESESDAIERWVKGGGALLLVTDHWPYGSAVVSLARRFGVAMGAGMVEDSIWYDHERGTSHIVFSLQNGSLRDHPIVRGRGDPEHLRRILTFTGQSVAADSPAVAFLRLAEAATERPPGPPTVTKKGGDVRVDMEYGEPVPVTGRAQGLALEHGEGRVVVLGEAGMLRAQKERDGTLVGMNVPGYDNRQLALNVMRWLSHAL
jgi:hypothetical protein